MTDLSRYQDFAASHAFVSRPGACTSKTEKAARAVIVVPCYNEAARLDATAFLSALDGLPGVDFVMVDDGSSDDTLLVLHRLAAQASDRISVLSLEQNGGKAEAVRQGLLAASDRDAAFLGFWDADLATPLNAIFDMVRLGEQFDDLSVIFGSRLSMLGHRIRRDASRRIVSRICNLMARTALGMPVGDTQCGAKLLRNTAEVRDALSRPFAAEWLFDVELFARIAARVENRHDAFYEFPLAEWHEVPGSKVSTRSILRAGVQMLRLIAVNRLGVSSHV